MCKKYFLSFFIILCLFYYTSSEAQNSPKYFEGLAHVKKDGKFGFIDSDGVLRIPYQFKDAGNFHSGFAAVADENSKFGFIDKTGKLVVQYQYDWANDMNDGLPTTPGNGVAIVKKGNRFGLINQIGEIIFPFELEADNLLLMINFTEGLYRCKKDGKWGYITSDGKVAVPFLYDSCDKFTDGIAMVEKDGKYFYINKMGEKVKDR